MKFLTFFGHFFFLTKIKKTIPSSDMGISDIATEKIINHIIVCKAPGNILRYNIPTLPKTKRKYTTLVNLMNNVVRII